MYVVSVHVVAATPENIERRDFVAEFFTNYGRVATRAIMTDILLSRTFVVTRKRLGRTISTESVDTIRGGGTSNHSGRCCCVPDNRYQLNVIAVTVYNRIKAGPPAYVVIGPGGNLVDDVRRNHARQLRAS